MLIRDVEMLIRDVDMLIRDVVMFSKETIHSYQHINHPSLFPSIKPFHPLCFSSQVFFSLSIHPSISILSISLSIYLSIHLSQHNYYLIFHPASFSKGPHPVALGQPLGRGWGKSLQAKYFLPIIIGHPNDDA